MRNSSHTENLRHSQVGLGGKMDFVIGLLDKGLSGPLITKLKKNIFKDPLLLKGENHIPQIKGKKIVLGNFGGPGTKVVTRIKRGDKPKTYMDKLSKSHDLKYTLARNVDDVRKADIKLMKDSAEGIRNIKKKKKSQRPKKMQGVPANRINLRITEKGMKFKMKLEDSGKLRRDAFAPTGTLRDEDRPLIENELAKMKQEGLGKRVKKVIPAKSLIRKMLIESDPISFASRKLFPSLIKEFRKKGVLNKLKISPTKFQAILKKKLSGLKGSGLQSGLASVLFKILTKMFKKSFKERMQKGKGMIQLKDIINRSLLKGHPIPITQFLP